MKLRQVPKHALPLACLQVVFIVLFGIFAKYAPDADAIHHPGYRTNKTGVQQVAGDGGHHPLYGMFQDVHVMIFIGFGFLMTFLKKYGLGSISFNFLVSAIAIQWALLVNGFFHMHDGYIEIGLDSLLGADFVAATVLISFGALLGKTTPLQLTILTMIEIPIFVINEVIGRKYFGAIDMGDSMFVHAFGAYFGLAVSLTLTRKDASTDKQGATKTSDLFSMIGTLFLWVYWPSFNAGAAPGDDQHRAVVNTYLSLVASCVAAFAVSSFLDPHRKFEMEHIQNSTLAGGVVIGTSADLMTQPWGAVLLGTIAGVVSVVGYHHISPFVARKLRIHDTCGVHNLHGMPAVIAGVAGAVYAALATETTYGASLYEIFPSRSPVNGSAELMRLRMVLPSLGPGDGRSATIQALYQLLALAVTMAISISTGLVTGLILRLGVFNKLQTDDLYDDESFFLLEEGEDSSSTTHSSGSNMHMVEEKRNENA